jgi:hypothetical protein
VGSGRPYRVARHFTINLDEELVMARRLRCALTVCAFLAIGQQAFGQTLGQAAVAARKTPAVDPALRADIEKLMVITGAADLGTQMASQISDAFLNGFKQNQNVVPPRALEIVREVVNAEFSKAFSGGEIREKQIALYAKYFTHADVKGLISFYESDLGRKTVANMPSLMREGGEIGQQWAQRAMPKMIQTLESRLKAEGLLP